MAFPLPGAKSRGAAHFEASQNDEQVPCDMAEHEFGALLERYNVDLSRLGKSEAGPRIS